MLSKKNSEDLYYRPTSTVEHSSSSVAEAEKDDIHLLTRKFAAGFFASNIKCTFTPLKLDAVKYYKISLERKHSSAAKMSFILFRN
jgi:hypothetical protein